MADPVSDPADTNNDGHRDIATKGRSGAAPPTPIAGGHRDISTSGTGVGRPGHLGADGPKHRTRRHLWDGRMLLRKLPPSDRRSWKIPKLRRVVDPAFRGGYLKVVTASLGELSGLFKS